MPPSGTLQASKTSDAYGLRLRFSTAMAAPAPASTSIQESKEAQAPLLSSLPTKKDDELSTSYYIVVTILILGIIVLFYIKKRVSTTKTKQEMPSWLFQENKEPLRDVMEPTNDSSGVSIRFQKTLNNENSVVMLDFADQSYLVLMGKSNIMLDKFTGNKPVTEDDFNSILQSRHKELEKFLNNDSVTKEPLQTYKEKAASILYEV